MPNLKLRFIPIFTLDDFYFFISTFLPPFLLSFPPSFPSSTLLTLFLLPLASPPLLLLLSVTFIALIPTSLSMVFLAHQNFIRSEIIVRGHYMFIDLCGY